MERYAGRYGLLKQLGKGGMGEVVLADDLNTGAEYALKRLTLGKDGPGAGLLRTEFEALARIRHPSIVRVVEFGFDFENAPFLVMEFIPGWPADQVVRPGAWDALALLAARVTAGLEALHAAGIAHGDLKPGNVLVGPPGDDGRPRDVRLVDFGLAALAGRGAQGHRGTPGYTAPEVVAGGTPDAAADLYALGATLFTLATGHAPFEGADVNTTLRRQQAGPPSALALEEAELPQGWIRLILHLMATSPAERPRGAAEVRRAIDQIAPATRLSLSERLAAQTMIGRDRELAQLERAWRRANRGARSLVVTGESGIGKSALLDAFAVRGVLSGRSVIRVSGAASNRPAAAWRTVVRRMAAEAQVDINELSAEVRDALADHAAEPDEPALAAIAALAAEWSRAIVARSGAPCVLLDDADALDAASLRALRRSMLGGESAPALWVLAHRHDGGAVAEEDRLLVSAGATDLLALEPIDRDAVARLAASRLGAEPPEELIEFLWHRAAGHAGLTIEAMRAAADAGALREEDLGVSVDAAALSALPMLADFEATRLGRLNALPAPARRAARLLAVRGVPLGLGPLRRIDANLTEEALAALHAQGLAGRDSEGRWNLVPPALSVRLLEDVPAETLTEIHAAILAAGELSPRELFVHRRGVGDLAGALEVAERAFSDAPDAALAAQAAELAAPHDTATAARWLERAARAWMDRGRYAKASPLVERALELDADPAARPDRWGMLTTCRIRNGDLDGVDRAAAAAKQEPLTDAALALIRTNEAARLSALGRNEEALAAAREAVGLAERAAAWMTLGAARLSEGMSLVYLGRLDEAMNPARRSGEDSSRGGDRVGLLRSSALQAGIHWLKGQLQQAEALFRSTLQEANDHHLRLAMEEVAAGHASVLISLGRWPEGRLAQAAALRVCLEDGRPYNAALGMANLALVDGLMGDLRKARIETRRAMRLARAHSPQIRGLVERTRSTVLLASGRPKAARRWAEDALTRALASGSADQRDWCLVSLGRAEARSNRWNVVSELTESALAARARQGTVADVGLAVLAGRAAIRLGAFETAVTHLAQIEAWPNSSAGTYAIALTQQLRAEIEIGRSNSGRAVEAADCALESFAALPATPDRSVAAFEFARLAIERRLDDTESIARWLDWAISGFERLGDRAGREQALRMSLRLFRDTHAVRSEPVRERNLIEVVGRLLDSLSDFAELVRRSMRLAVEQLNAERGLLLLMDPESGRLEPRAEHGAMDAGARRDATAYSRAAVARVAESGGSLLIEDTLSDAKARSKSVLDLGLRSILCVPMFRGGHVVGAVYLDDSRQAAFSEADRSLLEGFAQLMAIAIENSRGTDEVRRTNEILVGENLSLRQEVGSRFHPSGVIGTSSAMRRVLAVVERAAQVSATVLLTGENGTGKEKLARVLHHSGKRSAGPFVAVNCGAIPETLLESELFGHVRGSFSGAFRDRTGAFEMADRGTLFLDEIGEMPPTHQVRLLSVLSNREVTKIGNNKPVTVNVRVIAATNQDLKRRISEGLFREDLFYRLSVIPIEVPPLRDRKADIPDLARYFAEHFAQLQER
ncbi:MAG: sigma 54-interacting transcriptional regulator, partial [Candidatus Eisenbacteria bacterium]